MASLYHRQWVLAAAAGPIRRDPRIMGLFAPGGRPTRERGKTALPLSAVSLKEPRGPVARHGDSAQGIGEVDGTAPLQEPSHTVRFRKEGRCEDTLGERQAGRYLGPAAFPYPAIPLVGKNNDARPVEEEVEAVEGPPKDPAPQGRRRRAFFLSEKELACLHQIPPSWNRAALPRGPSPGKFPNERLIDEHHFEYIVYICYTNTGPLSSKFFPWPGQALNSSSRMRAGCGFI